MIDIAGSPLRKNSKDSTRTIRRKNGPSATKRKRKGEGGEDDEEEVGSMSEQTEDMDLKIPDTAEKVDDIQPKTENIDKGQSSKVAKRGRKPANKDNSLSKTDKDRIDLDRAKDAYCFSYVKESVFLAAMQVERIFPSQSVIEEVTVSDEALDSRILEYKERRSVVEAQIKSRKETYKTLIDDLAVKSLDEEFHFVPLSWLRQWVLGEGYPFCSPLQNQS